MSSHAARLSVNVNKIHKFTYRQRKREVLAGGVQLVELGQLCRAEIKWNQALTPAEHRTKPEVALKLTPLYAYRARSVKCNSNQSIAVQHSPYEILFFQ